MTKWEQQKLIEMIRENYAPASLVRGALGQLGDAISASGERGDEVRARHLDNMSEMLRAAQPADWKALD
jgi:hypothetical protein